jgi:hypothetical protein
MYAPEEGRKEESMALYELLQKHISSLNKYDYLIVAGDRNAQVGNKPIQNITGSNGESVLDENMRALRNFS